MRMLPELKKVPDPILKQRSSEVTVFGDELRELTSTMHNVMLKYSGVGLAAVQIGVLQRVMLVDLTSSTKQELEQKQNFQYPFFLINPNIISFSEAKKFAEEGCLSIPEVLIKVPRARNIKVQYQDLAGNQKFLECSGLVARVIQHEYDHLNGKLIIDYISPMKRAFIIQKLTKLAKA